MRPPSWTVLEVLRWTTAFFASRGIESPRISAELLLAGSLGFDRIQLYVHHDQPLSKKERERFKRLIRRRLRREPVAYILGRKEFWGLPLLVTPDVLVPRPETECLVESALAVLRAADAQACRRVLELGTGSGAVTLALASERPRTTYFASDRSPRAIAVARRNAEQHGCRRAVHFLVCHWFRGVAEARGAFDLILSNPPYIPSAVIETLPPEISRHEPRAALDGGTDGLACLRELVGEGHRYLKPGGTLLLEIGFDQRKAVAGFAADSGGYRRIMFTKDLAGRDRVVGLQRR
jgi:release factor glutamine methyltransferase